MCFEEAFGSKTVYCVVKCRVPDGRRQRRRRQMSQQCLFTWAGHKPSFFFLSLCKKRGKTLRASEETRRTLRFSRNCVFILEVEKQRDGFAIVLGRRGWDFLTREESLSDVSLLASVLLEPCSESSVWVATSNRREIQAWQKSPDPKTREAVSSQAHPHRTRGPSSFEVRGRADWFHFHTVNKFSCQVICTAQNFKTAITSQRAFERASPVHLEKITSSFRLQHFHLKPSGSLWLTNEIRNFVNKRLSHESAAGPSGDSAFPLFFFH